MVGAPRPIAPVVDFSRIDTRSFPVSTIDLNRQDGVILAKEDPWLVPNSAIKRQ
jgi:hypothetical protein